MIKVLFFASLKETLDCDGLEISETDVNTVAKLRGNLAQKGGTWATAIGANNTLVAVNQAMASDDSQIGAGDEVAFFPPVTGG